MDFHILFFIFAWVVACLQCFTLIDQNRDGFIDIDDLKGMFSSLGECMEFTFWGEGCKEVISNGYTIFLNYKNVIKYIEFM